MITKFELFERSKYHSQEDIDRILDRIIDNGGYEKLPDIEKKILKNFSADDAEIELSIENLIKYRENMINSVKKDFDNIPYSEMIKQRETIQEYADKFADTIKELIMMGLSQEDIKELIADKFKEQNG